MVVCYGGVVVVLGFVLFFYVKATVALYCISSFRFCI